MARKPAWVFAGAFVCLGVVAAEVPNADAQVQGKEPEYRIQPYNPNPPGKIIFGGPSDAGPDAKAPAAPAAPAPPCSETDAQFCARLGISANCTPFTNPDRCGKSRTVACAPCGAGQTCNPNSARCVVACVPKCAGKTCGPDGCGGQCGSCAANQSCTAAGTCRCEPNCNGKQCGQDGCGGICGYCAAGTSCTPAGQCACTPSCRGRHCGPDGCGGQCGSCGGGQTCSAGACVTACVPKCSGRACGPDGCGGQCGQCAGGSSCNAYGQCIAPPKAPPPPPTRLAINLQGNCVRSARAANTCSSFRVELYDHRYLGSFAPPGPGVFDVPPGPASIFFYCVHPNGTQTQEYNGYIVFQQGHTTSVTYGCPN